MEVLSSLADSPGLPALFLLSFLASTILPVGSEWLLVIMIGRGFTLVEVVLTASFGNFLGAATTYCIGIWGSDFLIRSVLRIGDSHLDRAKTIYDRYGKWSLLLSWLPVVGDPLCLVAGIFRVGFGRFALLVFMGKFSRYTALALLTQPGSGG